MPSLHQFSPLPRRGPLLTLSSAIRQMYLECPLYQFIIEDPSHEGKTCWLFTALGKSSL